MIFFIVGLGMMGSSYAKKLSNQGYLVYGYDNHLDTAKEALKKGYIKSYDLNHLKEATFIILCLYPKDNITFVDAHKALFNKEAFVSDISGIKGNMIDEIKKRLQNRYMSHHPMAGSEIAGIKGVNTKIFEGANFIIIDDHNTKEDIDQLQLLKEALGFGKTTVICREEHDQMIAFTSQLPHILALALVNSDQYLNTKDFTGDSYRDLTRIANINEALWAQLFLENKEHLLKDIARFQMELTKLKDTLEKHQEEPLKALMKKAKEKRNSY